ncbi:MAG: hypothetical protein AABX59_02225 [Nanoarchaeota archaeon]
MIIKNKNNYEVKSETSGRSFGKFGSKEAAAKRLREIDHFKKKK